MFDWGCCEEFVDLGKIYQASFDKADAPEFVQIYQGATIKDGERPDTLLQKPVRFVVLSDNYNIRFAPIIDDTSGQIWDDDANRAFHGNVIGKLPKGAKGFAYGKRTDHTGREWWYVEMDEVYFPFGYAFTKRDERFKVPTKVWGWISSRYVEKL